MHLVIVTGTDTGVGKTITTAAMVAAAREPGRRVAMVKPVQTGLTTGEPSDADTVALLSGGGSVRQLVTLADPLAPDTAARLRSVSIPSAVELADQVAAYANRFDVTFVEGAGGVAVRLDTAGGTVMTLAAALQAVGHRVQVVVVTRLSLGTLNATELTLLALDAQRLNVAGLVVGALPPEPDLAERCNLDELPRVTGLPLLGAIPAGVGAWTPARFQAECKGWLTMEPLLPQR